MSQVAESAVKQRMRTAAVAAAAVAAVLLVQSFLGNMSWLLVGYSQVQYNSGMNLGHLWLTVVYGAVTILAFAAGVFLSLGLLAPVAAWLTLKQALLRGLLAAVIGAGAALVLSFGFEIVGPMSRAGALFGSSFPWPAPGDTVQAATMAFQTGIGSLTRQAPVVMLVVVVAWIWLQSHPSGRVVSTDTAEV